MATLQARTILFAFVIMAGAISYNAIFLQEGRHPAPMSDAAAPERQAQFPAPRTPGEPTTPRKAKVLPRHDVPQQQAPQKADNVLAVQRHLTDKGYEPGPVDGVLGEQTRAAILAYEHDHQMQLSGEATGAVLKSLILGGSSDAAPDATGPMPEMTVALIKSVQQTLKSLGYEPGPVDGLLGSTTADAIRKFEKRRKLPVKGRISGRLVVELKDASGGRLSVIASN